MSDHDDHDDEQQDPLGIAIPIPLGAMLRRASQDHARAHAEVSDDWDRFYAFMASLDVEQLDTVRWMMNKGGPDGAWGWMQYYDGEASATLRIAHKVNPDRNARIDTDALLADAAAHDDAPEQ